jgi:hypothetical protein
VTHEADWCTGEVALWRHDVDFSIHSALKLAQIEAEEGVSTIYFLLQHSEFYNLHEAACTKIARDIHRLGHQVGLHFDHRYWGVNDESDLVEALDWERQVLERATRATVRVFTFHIPDAISKNFTADRYAGMINGDSKIFRDSFRICTDSNGYWKYGRLEEMLVDKSADRIQVLTHPEYWQDESLSPRERVERCIRGRAESTLSWYQQILEEHGRKDIGS